MSFPGSEFERIGIWREEAQIGDYRGALVIPQTPDGRILFQMRDDVDGIAAPGKWGLFGGGVDPGESPLDAVARELSEEIGVLRPKSDFEPLYAVLTGPPKFGLLYVFYLRFDLDTSDINVLEGGGFAMATQAQARKLDLIWYLRDTLEAFWAQKIP